MCTIKGSWGIKTCQMCMFVLVVRHAKRILGDVWRGYGLAGTPDKKALVRRISLLTQPTICPKQTHRHTRRRKQTSISRHISVWNGHVQRKIDLFDRNFKIWCIYNRNSGFLLSYSMFYTLRK